MPDRQFLVRTKTGRVYLDVRWLSIGLVVEIDGCGHREGLALLDDNFRQNQVSLIEDVVLRYGLTALRLWEKEVMDQVCGHTKSSDLVAHPDITVAVSRSDFDAFARNCSPLGTG
jgi:very-short-patch-repair endonuclease